MGTYDPRFQDHVQQVEAAKLAFTERDKQRAAGVDKRLVNLISDTVKKNPLPKGYQIRVNEGLRTKARQRQLVASGASQTMNSKHIVGDALDIAIIKPDGSYSKDFSDYQKVANVAKVIAKERGLNMTWGGDWKSLRDGPHFQVNKSSANKYNYNGNGGVAAPRENSAGGTGGSTTGPNVGKNLLAMFAAQNADEQADLEMFSDSFGAFLLGQHNDFVQSTKLSLDAATPDIDQLLDTDNG